MARAKKTAVESETSITAPKTRGIDLQEIEARVTALDKAKRRSYDIFDIEQRVYNLEKNGGGGGSSKPKFDLIQGTVASAEDIDGTATAKDNYTGYPAEDALLTNKAWIGYSNDTYWQFEFNEAKKVNAITWTTTDGNRNQTPTGYQVSYDGETFESVTPDLTKKGVLVAIADKPLKAFRVCYAGTYGTSKYPMMANVEIWGE